MCRKHVASQLWLGGGSYVQASRLKTVAPSSFMNGYQLPATRGNQAFGGLAWSYKVKMETFRCKTYALAYALASLLLTACAGDIDRFMENYKSAEGKDIDAVVKEIGMPDREGTIMGYKAYFWENTSHYSLVSAVPNTTTFSSYNSKEAATLNITREVYEMLIFVDIYTRAHEMELHIIALYCPRLRLYGV